MVAFQRWLGHICGVVIALVSLLPVNVSFANTKGDPPAPHSHFTVFVFDADLKTPMELVRVVLRRDHAILSQTVTSPVGIAIFPDIPDGSYEISAHFMGYKDFFGRTVVGPSHTADSLGLHEVAETAVVVTGEQEIPVTSFDLTTGNQVFETETYHAPPSMRMTNLIQENMLGAVRAPTGELHIRGMHGEYTYYVDGIPIPLGVFGGLNEVVDPKVISRATFLSGAFPAEYGGQTAAVINIENRVAPGRFHLDASSYVGSYFVPGAGDTLGQRVGAFKAVNSNGQNLSFSTHQDKLAFFVSGSRQETDRRIDPPVSELFHDHGFDYFLYGKIDYEIGTSDYLTVNLNYGKTHTQVPYDSLEAIMQDVQDATNAFQTVSYYHTFSSETDKESNVFVGAYAREGGLLYTPGLADVPSFQFAGDTTGTRYTMSEDRSFTTLGTRITFDKSLAHEFKYKLGLNFSNTTGKEDFATSDSAGKAGPGSNTNFTGSDFGVFGQVSYHPAEWTRFDIGVRYDQHIAPGAPFESQVSPRIRWTVMFDEFNTAYAYYGRRFMPTNIEGLRSIGSLASGAATQPPLPERDDLYEIGYAHAFLIGLEGKMDFFHRRASPGLDDATIGSSAIKTPVNIDKVFTTGVEAGLSFSDPSTPFSGYVNASLIHAYGMGPITGGFILHDVSENDGSGTDLDHDQRLSMVWSVNYQPATWFANLTAIYGSGLTNGNPNRVADKTGLFDFNTATHTAPSWIFDISVGYTFALSDGATLVPSLYVTNILDHEHLIKGAYFSGASYEERRNVVFNLAYHM